MDPTGAGDARRQHLAHTNLPHRLTSFVGRSAEVDELTRLIRETRLLTLTGAGGIGKTRLALEVAARVVSDHQDGVWLVELAGLTDPALVPQAVAAALGFMVQPGQTPTESLVSLLADRDMLCILDNCEHLIEAAAELADTLLTQCRGLRILATSRDVLGVDGEVVWRVPSMSTPDGQRPLTPDDLQRCDTVQLFVQRARAAHPGFEVNDGNAASVAAVSRRMDGIPLAIELVAARLRTMALPEIDQHIAARLDLVTGGSRTSLPRQRTLQAAFDWSWDLLDAQAKRLFRRLSVFAGGFTLEGARQVCGDGDDTATVLTCLSALVDKSLVIPLDGAPGRRYRLLEPIRQYGADRLADAQEVDAIRGRHARFYSLLGNAMRRDCEARGSGSRWCGSPMSSTTSEPVSPSW
jgi:predicted ATPase